MPAGKEMGMWGGGSRPVGQRIERAQAHCSREVFDRDLRVAEPNPDPPAHDPRCRQVRVEQNGPVDKSDSCIELDSDIGERNAATTQRDCITLVQLSRPTSRT